MRNIVPLFFCFLPMFFLLACTSDKPSKAQTDLPSTLDPVDLCAIPDQSIYQKAVKLWQSNWVVENHQLQSLDVNDLKYVFSQDNLAELYQGDAKQLRVYFCLQDSITDTIPGLALVNIFDCRDDLEKVLYVHFDEQGLQLESFIESETLSQLTANWRHRMSMLQPQYAPVYAYNYNWSTIHDIQEAEAGGENQDVHVRFGLRTLSPTDTLFDIPDPAYSGNVAYVTVFYAASPDAADRQFFDFSMPCPKKCDWDSPAMQVVQAH